ncbi:alpha/beta hydrolase [Arthrobacter sulfonylureivorans]|uniref:Alpha/beta hydrolase n=1 Tax=Arthrobacter sulfonylureivorans TaxID=2486855 RepID=A0ABY3WEY5_9MICC|nr:alpha/beta hydrolase [Arthrobacter sulfonylureivorans]UNK47763.1 alpha/beta hydrolase [Arthrobacter sulfonylureivorans]
MSLIELESLMPVLTGPDAPDFRLPPLEVRERFDTMLAGLPIKDGLAFENAVVGGVPGIWAVPAEAEADLVILYLHGGGYVSGSAAGYRGLAGLIAEAAGGRAFVPDYRLAPEHVYPAALDDALAAYMGLLDAGHEAGSITIAGDSAGGGLAAATVLAAKDRGLPLPGAVTLLSPWVDLDGTGTTLETKSEADPLISAEGLTNCAQVYLGDAHAAAPGASPLYGDFTGFPPLLIEVGTREVLLSDATRLAERAAAANVDVTLRTWRGMVHVFPNLWFALSEGPEAIAELGAFARRHTAGITANSFS